MRRIFSVPRGTLVNRLRRSTEGTPLLFSRQPSTTFGYSSRKSPFNDAEEIALHSIVLVVEPVKTLYAALNPEKNSKPETEYGKAPFAEKVVVPRAPEINWDGFRPLLDRISAVIQNYLPPEAFALSKAA